MESLSIAAQLCRTYLQHNQDQVLYQADLEDYRYALRKTPTDILFSLSIPNERILLIRLLSLSDPSSTLHCRQLENHTLKLTVQSNLGLYDISVQSSSAESFAVHYTVRFEPAVPLTGLYTTPEVLVLEEKKYNIPSKATTYVQQKQLRSGICFTDFGFDTTGTLFYFQDLSALNTYADHTQQSLADRVQIHWPELGLSLPRSADLPLRTGERYTLSAGHVLVHTGQPKDSTQMSDRFIQALEYVYRRLERPAIQVPPLPRYASYTLQSLIQQHGCWRQVKEKAYLNAYFNDYPTPAESMVQLAVLAPLTWYKQRQHSSYAQRIATSLTAGIADFFDDTLGCFVRWIPSKAHHLDHSEEQKKPRIMDSWYLHHPLIQLSFLLEAKAIDDDLEKKFYRSLRFCIQVAQHFGYSWPVFYDLDTFAVAKHETQPGEGGEKDVAGMYAFLMLRAYALSTKKIYLEEAKRAAKTLFRFGFDLLYQSNNTAYAAEALLQLWNLTQEKKYLSYSELCLGNLLRNTGIWERRYGNSKEYPSFFCLYPLSDAPYSAVFEEQECLASFHRYLRLAHEKKAPITAELEALLAEYVQYASCRLAYYLPPLLPEDILAPKVKTGYLSSNVWIPIEDLGDGWQAVGQVGQEVYGAGFIFQLLNYHYLPLADTTSYCYIGYPYRELDRDDKQVRIHILGSAEYSCMLQLYGTKQDAYTIQLADGRSHLLTKEDKNLKIKGAQEITIKWKS